MQVAKRNDERMHEVVAVTQGDCSYTQALMEVLSWRGVPTVPFDLTLDTNSDATTPRFAVVDAGKTLGEMSMIDGEARFATCVAAEPTVLAVLDRENLARIIVEQPMLGAKILMQLVLMLSQRLRSTSARLLQMMDEQSHRATSVLP